MARILVSSQVSPSPADHGGRIRVAQFLDILRGKHEVKLILVRRDLETSRYPAPPDSIDIGLSPREIAAGIARALPSGVPVQDGAFLNRRVWRQINAVARDHDPEVFVAFGPRAGLYDSCVDPSVARLIDFPDTPGLTSRVQWNGSIGIRRRLYAAENLVKARMLERRLVRSFDVTSVAGPADVAWLTARFPDAHVRLIPTAVEATTTPPSALPGDPNVLFTGDLRFGPNVDAARFLISDIWPRVARQVPKAQLWIVGHAPEPALRRLLEGAPCHTAFSVPDMDPYMQRARVVLAPMRIGSGMKVKVLTGMAHRRPVVMTSLANEGIGAVPDVHALVADDPGQFAASIVRLLRDSTLAGEVANAGQAFALDRFAPASVAEVLLHAVDEALDVRASRRHGLRTP